MVYARGLTKRDMGLRPATCTGPTSWATKCDVRVCRGINLWVFWLSVPSHPCRRAWATGRGSGARRSAMYRLLVLRHRRVENHWSRCEASSGTRSSVGLKALWARSPVGRETLRYWEAKLCDDAAEPEAFFKDARVCHYGHNSDSNSVL